MLKRRTHTGIRAGVNLLLDCPYTTNLVNAVDGSSPTTLTNTDAEIVSSSSLGRNVARVRSYDDATSNFGGLRYSISSLHDSFTILLGSMQTRNNAQCTKMVLRDGSGNAILTITLELITSLTKVAYVYRDGYLYYYRGGVLVSSTSVGDLPLSSVRYIDIAMNDSDKTVYIYCYDVLLYDGVLSAIDIREYELGTYNMGLNTLTVATRHCVPPTATRMFIALVGAGGAGGTSDGSSGAGGYGGQVLQVSDIAVSRGDIVEVAIGGGVERGTGKGNDTALSHNSTIYTAQGGSSGVNGGGWSSEGYKDNGAGGAGRADKSYGDGTAGGDGTTIAIVGGVNLYGAGGGGGASGKLSSYNPERAAGGTTGGGAGGAGKNAVSAYCDGDDGTFYGAGGGGGGCRRGALRELLKNGAGGTSYQGIAYIKFE